MDDLDRWKRLIAAWNNVPVETANLRPANDWTRAAWDRVYEAAIKHYLETSHGVMAGAPPAVAAPPQGMLESWGAAGASALASLGLI